MGKGDAPPRREETRLWQLIEARTRPDADVARIDAEIWDSFGESWAIAFTDLAGFSRRVERFGIIHFLQVILEQRRLLGPIIADHGGRLLKSEADSLLLLFPDARGALSCSVAMQRACAAANESLAPEYEVLLCIGLGYGRVLRIGDTDVWGAEVNAASKLGEDTARAYDILLTKGARDAVGHVDGVTFEPIDARAAGSASNFRAVYPPAGHGL